MATTDGPPPGKPGRHHSGDTGPVPEPTPAADAAPSPDRVPGQDRPAAPDDGTAPPEHDADRNHVGLGHTRAAATWTGLVIGVLVLILLLVFILQNLDSVTWNLFWWEFSLPLGVSLLLAAIAGALIMALAGGVRIIQIRRVAKRATANPR